MKKYKIYLETSAVSNLIRPKRPIVQQDMRDLWEFIKKDEYDIVVSSVTLEELNNNKNVIRREQLIDYLDLIEFESFIYTK